MANAIGNALISTGIMFLMLSVGLSLPIYAVNWAVCCSMVRLEALLGAVSSVYALIN